MNRDQLVAALGIAPRKLNLWIRQGLPCTGRGRRREFDAAAVRTWLISQGYAKERQIAKTQADVARHFTVAERTVAYWLARGCPGEPGNYDLDEIAAWREREGQGRSDEDANKSRFLQVKTEREQLKLEEERGDLVKVDPIVRLFTRHIAEARSRLDQLPDQITAAVARVVPAEELDGIRRRVQDTLDDAYQSLADLLKAEEVRQQAEGNP
jgi:phage terminase Nu1 subunit (DNA packaging protein)